MAYPAFFSDELIVVYISLYSMRFSVPYLEGVVFLVKLNLSPTRTAHFCQQGQGE